jgi:branched-chain amino acid transport system ATP-binding protein
LVEQDVTQAMRVASRVLCLLEGRTTLVGSPKELTRAQIEAAYFGLADERETTVESMPP